MAKYLIEVEHDSEFLACTQAVRVLLSSGSHFLTHAEWGCKDGVHKAWLLVDVDSKEDAKHIVPAAFHDRTRIIGLNRFTLEEVGQLEKDHDA